MKKAFNNFLTYQQAKQYLLATLPAAEGKYAVAQIYNLSGGNKFLPISQVEKIRKYGLAHAERGAKRKACGHKNRRVIFSDYLDGYPAPDSTKLFRYCPDCKTAEKFEGQDE